MEYLPTFPLECGHFEPNVGKYSLHGASGICKKWWLWFMVMNPMVQSEQQKKTMFLSPSFFCERILVRFQV